MKSNLAWIFVAAAACGSSHSPASTDAPVVVPDVYLVVMNVGGHCSVAIGDGNQPSTSAEQYVGDIVDGTTMSLTAQATAGFTLGQWHRTVDDTGAGDPGTITGTGQAAESTTSVHLGDEPGCVWICCSSASDVCPTTDPCQ